MENPYSYAPLQVTLYDVPAGAPVRSYMFLGNVSRSVLEAARRGTIKGNHPGRITLAPKNQHNSDKVIITSAWPETLWSNSDAAILQRCFGVRWRWLLTPRVGAALRPSCSDIIGGKEDMRFGHAADFGNLDDFNNLDIIIEEGDLDNNPNSLSEISTSVTNSQRMKNPHDTSVADWDPQTIYTDIATYPEDTFADLKAKIYAATGIPPYRQHLFYPTGGDDISEIGSDGWERATRTTYRITVEGALILTDIRRLSAELCDDVSDMVAGVPVDCRLEERKEDVRVDALDTFRTLEESSGVYVRRVFVADLATLLRVHGGKMQKALTDRYQFDLLYYGMVLKYWPTLTPEAFQMAISDPDAIATVFPLLYPPIEKIKKRLSAEKTIIDEIYVQSKAQQTRREREEKKGGIAITEASVNIEPRDAKTSVNLRNVFDWIPATRDLPALIARIPSDTMEVRGALAIRGRRDYILEKTHISAAGVGVAGALERFLARSPHRPGVSCAIIREAGNQGRIRPRALSSQSQFVFLTVYRDGRYTIKSSWREDDRVGFDQVIRQLSVAVQPVIELINAMGAAALPLGGSLETPSDASKGVSSRATIGNLTVSTFWPHALTTGGFRDMKTRWRDYEKAEIVGIRGLQQAGAYTFYFRKGITNYDPRAMERVVARGVWETGITPGRQVVTNHYAYLTDPATTQRWQYVYTGRLVRVYHRTTDLRIEMVGVDIEEFRRIQIYIFVFLDGLAYGPNRLTRGIVQAGRARPTEGRLRSLQERDPNLYDLKKFDEGATVYSVLCQGDRQPEIITGEESRNLGPKEKAALVKYWNFTEGRPNYYQCPSKRFPHLSFRAGEHPLGYCLPCCKKMQALPGSKAQAINRLCLQKHQITEDSDLGVAANDPLVVSRHVLSYSKCIPVGRISHIPTILSDGLFYDTIAPPFVYRLIGVTQQTSTIPNAGYFYAIASALSVDPEELAQDLADTAIAVWETYRSLASGGASVFASAKDLADAIMSTFLLDQPVSEALRFSPFGPGGIAAETWRFIIADLVNIRYDVDVVEFVDRSGDGSPFFEASATATSRIRACGREDRRKSVCDTPADVAILVTHPEGTYPMAAMDQKEFLHHAYGRGPARRFFSSEYHEDEVPDRVVPILHTMIVAETAVDRAKCIGPRAVFDLNFITELSATEGYRILYRLINLRDMCYGVILAPDPERIQELVYFPTPYSTHFLTPADPNRYPAPTALYGPRPSGKYPPQALAKVFAAANKKAGAAHNAQNRSTLIPRTRLVLTKTSSSNEKCGSLVGFVAEAISGATTDHSTRTIGSYFFHDPVVGQQYDIPLPWSTVETEASLPYEMVIVDREIYEAGGIPAHPALLPSKIALAEEGLYQYRLYRLFLAELAALLQDERDEKMRQALKIVFKKTRFSSPSSLADFRVEISQILQNFPEDADTIRGLVATLFARVGPTALWKALETVFDATVFDFDRTTLNRMRALGKESKVKAELRRLMQGQVDLVNDLATSVPTRSITDETKANDKSSGALMNMYVACSLPTSVGRPQCIRQRLRMPLDRYEEYISILATDILNPLKTATLGTMTAGVIDGSRFITRPGERILIR